MYENSSKSLPGVLENPLKKEGKRNEGKEEKYKER